MAVNRLGEYLRQDPQTAAFLANLQQQAAAANTGTHLGGLSSLVNKLTRGYVMGQDAKQRREAQKVYATGMATPYSPATAYEPKVVDPGVSELDIKMNPEEYDGIRAAGVLDSPGAEAKPEDGPFIAAQRGLNKLEDNPYATGLSAQIGYEKANMDRNLAGKLRLEQQKKELGLSDNKLSAPERNYRKLMKLREKFPPIRNEKGVLVDQPQVEDFKSMVRANVRQDIGASILSFSGVGGPNNVANEIKKTVPIQQRPEFKAAVDRAVGKNKNILKNMEQRVTDGKSAARILPTLRRSLVLLDSIKTGGIDSVKIRAKKIFGIEGADEGELSQNLGKAVLSQLRQTFGAAFTEKEGDKLEAIEAGFSKSPEANKRMLNNLLKFTVTFYNQGIAAANDLDDPKTAKSIRELGLIVLGDDVIIGAPRKASKKLSIDEEAMKWAKQNPNDPRSLEILKKNRVK
tara:strand:- start:331 stop:1707 length:1377 start_codon:yes stop_codon:yes gene_type:complete